MSPVAVDLLRTRFVAPSPISSELLAIWWPSSGVDAVAWEYAISGGSATYQSTIATRSLGYNPAGFFPTAGENLAWRSCLVQSNAQTSMLLVMADEVADVIAAWDIENDVFTSGSLQVQSSPAAISEPLFCSNVGDGFAYVTHTETDGLGDETGYVHKVGRATISLFATVPQTDTLGPLIAGGFAGGGQSPLDIGTLALFREPKTGGTPNSILHEVDLVGGSINSRDIDVAAPSSRPMLGDSFMRDSSFASAGSSYPGMTFPLPANYDVRLANCGYSGAGPPTVFGWTSGGGYTPPDKTETSAYGINKSGTAVGIYEADRSATPSGLLKFRKWKDSGHSSNTSAAPTVTIYPSDYAPPSAGTDAMMPSMVYALDYDPGFA